jgi:hypothetical protein
MDELVLTVRMLSHCIPVTLSVPYTIQHLREELLHETEVEATGVEYLSLYDKDGRCQLDDDLVYPDQEYLLFVHTNPVVRYYIEQSDEVRELEVALENITVKDIYDTFWASCVEEGSPWTDPYDSPTFYLFLREGRAPLYYTDDLPDMVGKEVIVTIHYPVEPYELE